MKRNVLVFGTIAGVLISAFMGTSMAMMACGPDDGDHGMGSMIMGFSAMIVSFSFVFVGIKNFRDKQNRGIITFGKAFLLGTLISLIASTMYTLTWAVEFHFFLPDFMDGYSAMQIKELQESGISGDSLETAIQEIKSTQHSYETNPFFFAMYTYMEIFPVGIIISLISALILKKRTPAE